MSDKLINLVKMHPILYDMSSKNNAQKYEVWNEIAGKLGLDNGMVAKAKWRNIRDSYIKFLKTRTEHLDHNHYLVKKYIKWPWAEHMKFIDPYVGLPGRIIKTDGEGYFKSSLSESDCDLSDNVESQGVFDNEDPLLDVDNRVKAEPTQENDVEIAGSSDNKVITIKNVDPVDLLFLSHAQTLKTFPKRKQIELKMQIALILSTAEMERAEQEERNYHHPQ